MPLYMQCLFLTVEVCDMNNYSNIHSMENIIYVRVCQTELLHKWRTVCEQFMEQQAFWETDSCFAVQEVTHLFTGT